MKVSDYISKIIASQGIKYVFGYQGGNIAHIIDSIGNNGDLEFVTTYNEQGAAFAACGYALENETLGVALASSGPGAINLISGIASAYYDSIPTLFLTGNVSLHTMKQSDEIRQNAFQENDIVSMVSKITKYAVTVRDVNNLKYHLEKALYLAKEGRSGPVLLDLPHNIQKADIDADHLSGFIEPIEKYSCNETDIDNIIQLIGDSSKPVIVVGGGARDQITKIYIEKLLKIWCIPVVATLRGLDVVSHRMSQFVGFGGAYGVRSANLALKYADTILVLGARLDERFICLNDKSIFENKNIIHVDIDKIELGRVIHSEVQIQCTLDEFLKKLLQRSLSKQKFEEWNELINCWKRRFPSVGKEWSINKAVYELTSYAKENATFSLDIGINQMCAAQSMVLNGKQKCFTSAGHGAMGCSLPTAIGAAYANRGKVIDCYVGDGALHMNIQELLMLSRENLPVHVILNNNKCLGMIRDFQTKVFNSRFIATVNELQEIDYELISKAYMINYCKVDSIENLKNAMELIQKPEPCFIELVFEQDDDTNPKLGTDMFNQIPLLSADEINKIDKEVLKL